MESGFKYIISKEGLIKFIVIAFACVTFALLVDTYVYDISRRMQWVFAAFVVSFAISVLLYVFRVSGLANKTGTCGPCNFDGVDFIWSWFSTIWCLAAAVAFATVFPKSNNFNSWYNKMITAIVFAFLTGIAYAVEAYILKSRAPANLGYISTRNGWLKTVIVALGAAAFGLLVDSGYTWCRGSCHIGITYALAAYVIGWGVTVIIWLLHIFGVISSDHQSKFRKVEFLWSVICVLLFLSASSVFAAYMRCGNNFRGGFCQMRLAGVIIGFITGVLFIIDAVLNKP